MPRKRVYASAADRQRAYRDRVDIGSECLGRLIEALEQAADRGRCPKRLDRLPEGDVERTAELCRRLDGVALVAFRNVTKSEGGR